TVANLRSYGSPVWRGRRHGQKVHSLRAFAGLPARATRPLAIALRAHRDDATDVARLRAHGWRTLDADWHAGTVGRYEHFVRRSFAEIGIAKEGYVVSRCGWCSDRTAVYLASGRPAIVQ